MRAHTQEDGPIGWFNFLFIAAGFLCSATYFIFTREHKGVLRPPPKMGRCFLMLALGVYFGNTVLFRMAMLSGRAEYLLKALRIIPWD
ncbi:MAG: hypothetical protein AOA65_0869 [Candidatus Bathyarchaeota archaeon BA1]|nr:MAG: hypothetical protein AOA65_0869 [Candidatus Bathyarchaeota archaeon BA1]